MSPTIVTIAIDPGVTTGYAVFHGKTLMAVGTWRKDHGRWLQALVTQEKVGAGQIRVIIEQPGVRFHAGAQEFFRMRGLAVLNQRIGGYEAIARLEGAEVIKVLPANWMRGRRKKRIKLDMGLIYRERLDALNVWRLGQDGYDALGLGHWVVSQPIQGVLKKSSGASLRMRRKGSPVIKGTRVRLLSNPDGDSIVGRFSLKELNLGHWGVATRRRKP